LKSGTDLGGKEKVQGMWLKGIEDIGALTAAPEKGAGMERTDIPTRLGRNARKLLMDCGQTNEENARQRASIIKQVKRQESMAREDLGSTIDE
jgi:hypothetical protein